MSLLSSIIIPHLEKELIAMEPQMAMFLLGQFKSAGQELVDWAESKLHTDINGDGKIGAQDASN